MPNSDAVASDLIAARDGATIEASSSVPTGSGVVTVSGGFVRELSRGWTFTDTHLALLVSAALFVLGAWPLALTEVPPYQDLPNHLAALTVIDNPGRYPSSSSTGSSRRTLRCSRGSSSWEARRREARGPPLRAARAGGQRVRAASLRARAHRQPEPHARREHVRVADGPQLVRLDGHAGLRAVRAPLARAAARDSTGSGGLRPSATLCWSRGWAR